MKEVTIRQIYENLIINQPDDALEKIEIVEAFQVNEEMFYSIKYTGKFQHFDKLVEVLYGCLFDGCDEVMITSSEKSAQRMAFCEYMKKTGKSLPTND